MKEMVGGCCVCSDERGWPENPLVYCDGQNCTVAVHQACYGIVTVPTGPWYCRKCESQERSARVRCELCPSRDGALKKTDNQGWAHVVCALYIPEVRFGNVSTMEPIILALIPAERYSKSCYICVDMGKGSKANVGACMQCNKSGCKQQFHVTCAQQLGLLCEEAGNYLDNVKYCGYCQHHYSKLKKGGNVKPIPPYKPISHETNSSDSPSSPEKDSDITHSNSRSNRPTTTDPLATSTTLTSSSSSSSKQKKSSNAKSSSSSSSNAQIPYTSSSNAQSSSSSNVVVPPPPPPSSSSTSSSRTSSSSSKDKDKDGKHSSSSSSKNVNKISSSTNKHDKDPSSYSSYSTSSSRGDKNKSSSSSSSSSSKSSHQSQNASNKDDGVTSNSHNSKSSSQQFSTSTTTIRITTSSATPTSPVSTIIHKHDGSTSSGSTLKDNVVQSSVNSIISSQIQNSSKLNDDSNDDGGGVRGNSSGKMSSSWHQNNMSTTTTTTVNAQKTGLAFPSSGSSSLSNSDTLNDNNDANKANYSAMTKKRKAMHQANSSSNRNSADENVNKDICKDLSVKVVPIDKFDPSVSEFERHYKKARTDLNSQSTPATAAVAPPTLEPNIQNVNPNVIHSSSSSTSTTTASNVSPHISSPTSIGSNNKSQVITQNIHAKSTSGGVNIGGGSSSNVNIKDDRPQQQPESLVVSVPLSANTVPGIQLPTNSSNNNNNNNTNTSNSPTVSTIVNTSQVQMQTSSPTMSVSVSSSSIPNHGSLYQHLTNNQSGNQRERASPLVQNQGRLSPITPTTSSLNDIHGSSSSSTSNHTSVLQNMNSGVISNAAFHGTNLNATTETTATTAAMHKANFEKQPASRLHAIQQEETSRRSRSQTSDGKKGKKRTNNSSTSSSTNHTNKVTLSSNNNSNSNNNNNTSNARTQSNHKSSKSNAKNNNNNGGGSLSIGSSIGGAGSSLSTTSTSSNVHLSTNLNNNNNNSEVTHTHTTTTTQSQSSAIVKLSSAPSTGSARTSSPIVNVTIMKKYRDEPSTSRTPDMSAFTSSTSSTTTITAGGLKFGFEPQQSSLQAHLPQHPSGLVVNTATIHHSVKESPPSSPGSEASSRKRRKGTSNSTPLPSPGFQIEAKKEREEKEAKTAILQNGAIVPVTHHMLGNQINPSSTVAKNMTDTLNMEIEAHSIYTNEPQATLIGPQYPGRKDSIKNSSSTTSSTSTSSSSGPASLTSMLSGSSNGAPQSLEQLLERQWEQGSQFLMEQAQHFDIASLLSCLHQLKIENSRLEDHINGLVSRRDHLLAVNARLAIPLGQPSTSNQVNHNGPTTQTEPTPQLPPQQSQLPQQQQQQHQQSHTVGNKRSTNTSNSVSTIQVPPPIENGLDYRAHHSITSSSSSNQIPSSLSSSVSQQHQQQQQQQQSSSNIRPIPTAGSLKGNIQPPQHSSATLAAVSQVVTIDTPLNPSQSQLQYQSNAQFQQMYQQQTHVNSVRSRQTSSYQSQQHQQQNPTGSIYPPPSSAVHKTKN